MENKKTTISLIAAVAKDRGIGYKNKLLIHLPPDLKHFKAITSGHSVIMGQTTYESMGGALPNRTNIILTNDQNFKAPGCVILHSLEEALDYIEKSKEDEVFFIGGASVYKQAIDIADKLYLTIIDAEYQADVWFPDYSNFKIIKEESAASGIRRIKAILL